MIGESRRSGQDDASTRARAQPEALRWRVHLAARAPRKAAAAALAILASGVVVHFGWPGLPLAPVAVVLLFLALGDFFLPIHYRLTDTEVTVRAGLSVRRIAWDNVRRWARDAQGVRVSPLTRPSRLDAYRGVYLRFPDQPEMTEEVLRQVARHAGQEHVR